MARTIVMQCATPVMSAEGVQLHAPGDQLPEWDPAIAKSPSGSWYPVIVELVEAPEGVDEPAIENVQEPHPESTVRTADEAVQSEVSKPVDF